MCDGRIETCLNCPYADCIRDKVRTGAKRGRKPLSPEERERRKKEYNRRWYMKNREKRIQQVKEYKERKREADRQRCSTASV